MGKNILPEIFREEGEYIDSIDYGEYGVFGLTKERAEVIKKFFEDAGVDVKVEKNEVLANTYVVYFH